ncbi:MAG: hypothetical protein R3F31_00525 [Verrucomicrobiales bacterium]
MNLTEVLGYVTKATGRPKVVLLDCCRDRPAKRTATGKVAEGGAWRSCRRTRSRRTR